MKRYSPLLLLFVALPTIELILLLQLGQLLGVWPTIGLIIATGVLGSRLALHQGLSVWKQLNQKLQSGALPGETIVDGVIVLVAGALLITPGMITDIVGFMGLVPSTRNVMRKLLLRWAKGRITPTKEDTWQGNSKKYPEHARDQEHT